MGRVAFCGVAQGGVEYIWLTLTHCHYLLLHATILYTHELLDHGWLASREREAQN